MNPWLTEIVLTGEHASLIPMRPAHRDALVAAAMADALWKFWYTEIPTEDTIDRYMQKAFEDQSASKALPYVVVDHASDSIVGATRFLEADSVNRRLEIGKTWYAKRVQRTAVNAECKLMLLTHAFEQLEAIAVEFRTHWHNHTSRNALERLGAKQDGVLRNHQRIDGCYRDTVVFSIINQEWPTVRRTLLYKLGRT